MRIILFTQEDPFYLYESTIDLINKIKINGQLEIVQAIITPPSPFGSRETFFQKVIKTLKIFGFEFFIYYSYKYLIRKILYNRSVYKVFRNAKIPVSLIRDSINSKNNIKLIKKLNADLILIIAGNQIIKREILNSTKYGVFNVHSSLLPYYKGLMPTFWVLKNEESKTGVTLYKLQEGIDDGPIISFKVFKLNPAITQSRLIKELKILANELIVESIHKVKDINNYKEQDKGTYFKFPKRKDIIEFKKNKKFF